MTSSSRTKGTVERSSIAEEENELPPTLGIIIGADKMAELGELFERIKGTVATGAR